MRPLEMVVVALLLPYMLHLLSPSRGSDPLFDLLPIIVVLVLVSHLIFEGYRWQMVPAYLLAVFFCIYELCPWIWSFQLPYLVVIVCLAFELATIVLATVLPVFELPEPTGPYQVGTQIRYMKDDRRIDAFSDKVGGARELMVQIWYPADRFARGQFAPYRDKRITRFADVQFALVKTHSILDAQLSKASDRYSVIFYTPSWTGLRTENTHLMEELASHGYIVVGIDHPYSTRATIFPDGRIARRKFAGDEDYSSPEAFASFVSTADQQAEIRAQDASFVLDTLQFLDKADPEDLLTGRLALDRVGIFGFSFGGATAAEACFADSRFSAALNLDGMLAGESARGGTHVPYFFIAGAGSMIFRPSVDLWKIGAAKRREIEFQQYQDEQIRLSLTQYGGYWVTIPGLSHLDFSDYPFFSPLRFSGVRLLSSPRLAPTDIVRNARMVRSYVLAFFDERLKKIAQPLLAGPSKKFPEVMLQVWKGGSPPYSATSNDRRTSN